ncbi:hypothetical protein F2P79_020857 [Pimephales promelas]|nr:hypothetical protein F2P79_020857 [Pimephales promelas]
MGSPKGRIYGTQPESGSRGFSGQGPGSGRSAMSGPRDVGGLYRVRTREETSSTRRLQYLANVLGVAQPAALQISVSEAPRASARKYSGFQVLRGDLRGGYVAGIHPDRLRADGMQEGFQSIHKLNETHGRFQGTENENHGAGPGLGTSEQGQRG